MHFAGFAGVGFCNTITTILVRLVKSKTLVITCFFSSIFIYIYIILLLLIFGKNIFDVLNTLRSVSDKKIMKQNSRLS